jgi:hypothetical protein
METQKFMGRNMLVDRLAAQVGGKDTAIAILKKRGQMNDAGALTTAGQKRNDMTAEERAKDRASTASGKHGTPKPAKAFIYNPKTNTAKLKKG